MRTKCIYLSLVILLFCSYARAQWVQTNGPYGGPVTCFAVSGMDIFAGVPRGGVFRSTDNGKIWKAASTGLTNTAILALAIDGSHLFAGTSGGGVFLSTNNGTSWTATSSTGVTNSDVRTLVVSGTNLFAGTSDGVFLSTDNGSSWAAVKYGLPYPSPFVNALAVLGTNLFAGTATGVFISTNNGSSWIETSLRSVGYYIIALAVAGTNLFAGTNNGVFLSTNSGTSWTEVDADLPKVVSSIAISGTSLFAGTSHGVLLSTNNGANWTAAGLNSFQVMAFGVLGTNIFAGTDCGVFVSADNGSNWVPLSTGGNPDVHVVALAARGAELFAGTTWGSGGKGGYYGSSIFHSTNNGDSWVPQMTGHASCFAMQSANVFAGMGGVFLSTNSGTSWTETCLGLFRYDNRALVVAGANLFAGTSRGVFLSSNGGTSWTEIDDGLPPVLPVSSLAISPADGGAGATNLFAGASGYGVFLSTNSGTSWNSVNDGLTNTGVSCLAVSPNGAGGTSLFAGTGGGVFVSTNNGTSWSGANMGLTDTTVLTLAVSPADGGAGATNLLAGTPSGVFLSTNNGSNWQLFNSGLNQWASALCLNDTYVFAGTGSSGMISEYGAGVWRRLRSEMLAGVETPVGRLPSAFELNQNYPNPFNPSTTIQFSIKNSEFSILRVYDILGREVAVLVNERKLPGSYTVRFDAKGLASGVYIYRLTVGEFHSEKKMVVVR